MKAIERIETFDGEIHPSYRQATKHLDELFGAILCPLAQKLVQIHKYSEMLTYLETQVETMRYLVRIRDDMTLEKPEE